MALDGELIEDLSVLEPFEHSLLEVARNGRPMAGISILEPLEHSVPEVSLVWGDCSLIRMTVSDPLEHSGLGVTWIPYGWRHGTPAGRLGVAIDLGWLSGGTCCVVLLDYLVCRCFRLRVI